MMMMSRLPKERRIISDDESSPKERRGASRASAVRSTQEGCPETSVSSSPPGQDLHVLEGMGLCVGGTCARVSSALGFVANAPFERAVQVGEAGGDALVASALARPLEHEAPPDPCDASQHLSQKNPGTALSPRRYGRHPAKYSAKYPAKY